MALLTLEAEQTPCHWPAIEDKIASLLPDLAIVSQAKAKRTYHLKIPDHGQPIPLLKKLQALLAHDDVHFFVDLKS